MVIKQIRYDWDQEDNTANANKIGSEKENDVMMMMMMMTMKLNKGDDDDEDEVDYIDANKTRLGGKDHGDHDDTKKY